MNSPKSLIYLVLFVAIFVSYIYLYNVREYIMYDDYLTQLASEGCGGNCEGRGQYKFTARILAEPSTSGRMRVVPYRGMKAYIDSSVELMVGDKIEVIGTLEKSLITKGKFEYKLMHTTVRVIDRVLAHGSFSPYRILYWISSLSNKIGSRLALVLSPIHASLLAGMIFGLKESFPKSFYDALIKSGTVHVISASGYNIAFLVDFCRSLFGKFFSRKTTMYLTIVLMMGYTAMAGFGSPIVRATIMALVAYGGKMWGRNYQALWALGLTAGLMLVFNPLLISSVSFLLSVSATGGIVMLSKGLSLRLMNFFHLPKSFMILAEDFGTTLSAIIVTLPILLIYFGSFSLWSVLANMLVLWVISPIMLLGSGLVLVSFVSMDVARIVAILCKPLLEYFIRIISWIGGLPSVQLQSEGANWYFGFGYYILLISIYLHMVKRADV